VFTRVHSTGANTIVDFGLWILGWERFTHFRFWITKEGDLIIGDIVNQDFFYFDFSEA
jgi:hypothetical protein